MPSVRGDIPNLINGVSQQAPALRLPTQAEAQVNWHSTVLKGLVPRPHTSHVTKLLSTVPSSAWTHIIDRDSTERYVVVSDGGQLKVFDFAGVQKTVNAPDGWSYLSSATTPSEDLRAFTTADYTFVVNKKVVPAMGSATAPTRNPEALIYVVKGTYGHAYAVYINGGAGGAGGGVGTTGAGADAYFQAPGGGTPGSDAKQIQTTNIADQLYTQLVAAGFNTTPWQLTPYDNVLHLTRTDGVDFTIATSDGGDTDDMRCIKGAVKQFSDLPHKGPEGFIVEVLGSPEQDWDNYWVEFRKTEDTQDVWDGLWHEVIKPGEVLGVDKATMPHILVREADGTFTFKKGLWEDRECGDAEINGTPSFIGQPIQKVSWHRGRLVFLADENVITSCAGRPFDLWRSTAVAVLDDDPIDVSASHAKVSFLKHATAHKELFLVWAEGTQFRVTGNDLLSPKTVAAPPISEYRCSPVCEPIVVADTVFFVSEGDEWGKVFEYVLDKSAEDAQAEEITEHVPYYIPSGVFKLIGAGDETVLFALTDGDTDGVYVYRFYRGGDGAKLQASWSLWEFPGATVLNGGMIDRDLYLVLARSDGVYLEKLQLDPELKDAGLDFTVRLDRRVSSSSGAYDSLVDRTTYTLPIELGASVVAVRADGTPHTVYSQTGVTVVLSGDTRGSSIFFGIPYSCRYAFSTFYPRAENERGSFVETAGRTQVSYLKLVLDQTSVLDVEVTGDGRAAKTYSFAPIVVDEPDFETDTVNKDSRVWAIPIMHRNTKVLIEAKTSDWRSARLVSARWTGRHDPRSLRP